MALFVIVVAAAIALIAVAYPTLQAAFMTNPILNGIIVGILVIGILFNFRQVLLLRPAADWIESYQRHKGLATPDDPPRLLSPMAGMLRDRRGPLRLTAPATRSILDAIGARLDESREIARYMIGLLIFLGLLGTFWGLLQTIGAVADVVGSLTVGGGDIASIFSDLKRGLQAPLAGMGTAFSSSLFGLGGSLVLGFLDLQAGQAQNRFYNDLEDWLSGQTKLATAGVGVVAGDGDGSVPAYIQALLEQTAESMDKLQRTVSREDDRQATTNANIMALAERVSAMTEQVSTDIRLLAKTIAALADQDQREGH